MITCNHFLDYLSIAKSVRFVYVQHGADIVQCVEAFLIFSSKNFNPKKNYFYELTLVELYFDIFKF